MNAMTVKFPEEVAEKLEQLAEERDSSTAALVVAAVREFLAREEAELDAIRASLAAADRGEFATDEDIKAILSKYN